MTRNANSGDPARMNSVPLAVLYDLPSTCPPRVSRLRVSSPEATSIESPAWPFCFTVSAPAQIVRKTAVAMLMVFMSFFLRELVF